MKFKSQVYTQTSGSIGGLTYSHNSAGLYTRARTVPTNPNTGRQNVVRNRFSAFAKNWSILLSQAERNAWNLYASQVTIKDALGDDINISGQNMYIRTNCVALPAGVPPTNSGPTVFLLGDSDPTFAGAISEATQLITVTFDDTLPWASIDDGAMLVAMSRPVNVGVNFITPTLRIAGGLLGNTAVPLTSPQTLTAPFIVTAGQKVLLQGRILEADGRLSEPFQVDVTAAA